MVSELALFDRSFATNFVIGADEVGRGCLAGPIVGAAVVFDYSEASGESFSKLLGELGDSKKKSAKQRERLYPRIIECAFSVTLSWRSAESIDLDGLQISNIAVLAEALTDASLLAGKEGSAFLVDGFDLSSANLPFEAVRVIKGDQKSAAIAAASIVAKVSRDRCMQQVAEIYPEWGFDRHVGYGTRDHLAAITEHGITPLHRKSFRSAAYRQLELA